MSSNAQASGIPKGYDPQLYRIRHTTAHVMAQAVLDRFAGTGDVHFAAGPPVEHGFYYDFALPRTLTPDDLTSIETRMREIIRGHHALVRHEVTPTEARELFAKQPFKLELIDGLTGGQLDEDGNPIAGGAGRAQLTVYSHDTFSDLCKGPHVASTAELEPDAIKLLNVAGAYWRGDERRPMLQRIYGTSWRRKDELDKYLWQCAEAERRDHRKLGKELELFHFDQTAPGMPYWLPNGFRLLRGLLDFWREEHDKRGYKEISAPLVNDRKLWEQSGHWEHYVDNMFVIPLDEHRTYGIKPMNCPNAMVIWNLRRRSYRELPLRLSDCDVLHRHERSGSLHGLLRVQKFQQDDAHIFVSEDQIEAEFDEILEICQRFYSIFGLNYSFRVGTRPTEFLGDVESWERAEAALFRILDKHCGKGRYGVEDGDGAFYGPKIDIMMEDALGRSWQMGTIQLDFQLPRRFDCTYIDRDGGQKHPVVIHRVIYGSLERFIGVLIEDCAGAFPVWIAPVQAVLIPISDGQVEYCRQVASTLREARLRVEVDDSNERMNNKIRQAQNMKVPYMLVIGKREVERGAVSLRLRTEENVGELSVEAFIARARKVVADKQGL